MCIDMEDEYLRGGIGRFQQLLEPEHRDEPRAYKMYQPGHTWNGKIEPPLPEDGGKKRVIAKRKKPLAQ